jgi:hypothetical protein
VARRGVAKQVLATQPRVGPEDHRLRLADLRQAPLAQEQPHEEERDRAQEDRDQDEERRDGERQGLGLAQRGGSPRKTRRSGSGADTGMRCRSGTSQSRNESQTS